MPRTEIIIYCVVVVGLNFYCSTYCVYVYTIIFKNFYKAYIVHCIGYSIMWHVSLGTDLVLVKLLVTSHKG